MNINNDAAQYIASLIPAERGQIWTLQECMYGNEADDKKPVKQFVIEMTENYPEIWRVVQKTEGLIVGSGIHAGGIIFVDDPFTESTALMKAPNGDVMTQFELHTAEKASLIKMDMLSVETMDKLQICIELLADSGYIKKYPTLRETYENCIGIYNLERDDIKMWEMTWNHEIASLFQMDQGSGLKAIALCKPTSVDDLATINSVIRLMPQEKGGEMPIEKFARFKADISLWYDEMRQWGLTDEEMKILEPIAKISYGITESQESFMQLVQMPECGGFDLTWADRLRKSIAKKNPKEFDQLTIEYYENCKAKGLSEKLCNYVWQILVGYSKGYGFNKSHTLAYSLIALQQMNLAYKYPIMFWNCANLISEAGGSDIPEEDEELELEESSEEETYSNEMEEFNEDEDEAFSSYEEEEDCDGYPAEIFVTSSGKKKKKVKATNYGKVSAAIGKIQSNGVQIEPPDINKSSYTFSPDLEHNSIRFGLSGITRIGGELVKNIIANRPYTNIYELEHKIKINKPQVINLIKAGAFDFMGPREAVMKDYIKSISNTKKHLNMQNLRLLIESGLVPDQFELTRKCFNFNKYIRQFKKDGFYLFDAIAFRFFENNFDLDYLMPSADSGSGFKIKTTIWDKLYKDSVDSFRPYLAEHQDELLDKVNNAAIQETWDKYCGGSIEHWEMESISCYINNHELSQVNESELKCENFFDLPVSALVDHTIKMKDKMVPIFKTTRIMGTVLDKDKNHKTITLLTKGGVVVVKIYGVFADYDKQISRIGADGKKHVERKSEFSRGTKLIINGIRSGDEFVAKKYKSTVYPLIETIVGIQEGKPIFNNRVL